MMRDVSEKAVFERRRIAQRQVAAGYSIEELEQVLAPMAEDGKEMIASMGDDTPECGFVQAISPAVTFLPPEL